MTGKSNPSRVKSRHEQWPQDLMIKDKENLTVKEWCLRFGVGIDAYKYRMSVVKKEQLQLKRNIDEESNDLVKLISRKQKNKVENESSYLMA